MATDRLLRWLCWGLVVAAIVSAVCSLALATNLWAGGPTEPDPSADLIAKLQIFRANDLEVFPVQLVGGIATIVLFVIVGLLGVAMRPYAWVSSPRDAMATLLIIAAVVGVVSQVMLVALSQAATLGYCDCGYKTQELISQDYALSVGWNVQAWMVNIAVAITGVGIYAAGRLITVTNLWRSLSYVIGAILLIASAIHLLTPIFFLPESLFQWTDITSGLTLAILVPIWAVLLLRGIKPMAQVH